MRISRRQVLKGSILITAAAASGCAISPALANETHRVTIKSFAFLPKELKIKPGDTVEWRNLDGFIHTATSDEKGLFDTDMIRTGWSAFHTFGTGEVTNEISYHCEIYPTMKAKIIIEA